MTDRRQLYEGLLAGPMFQQWHWLAWNFSQTPETPFARITLDALLRCDAVMPGYAEAMLRTVSSIGGRERNQDDYEAIKQWLGELLVVHHFITWPWQEAVTFAHEPAAGDSAANPEITVMAADWSLGVEVKTPDLRQLANGGRQANDYQFLARFEGLPSALSGSITLPRDNPIKDFLISADRKFAGHRATSPNFYGMLFIVWDDYINEPISALLAPGSGLLTPNSFYTDADGNPRRFPNVDGIVLIRHQHQFIQGMANRDPIDQRRHFLDYGDLDRFPPNAVLPNLHTKREPPQAVADSLQAYLPDLTMGAEYSPAEIVIWT